jgi:hypothetical protein
MPGFLLHVNATMQCFHLAPATIAPSQPRVVVSGQPVATMASQITVAGCPFQIPVVAGTKPQPCVTVKWTMPSTRFVVGGQPAALLPSVGTGPGICQSAEQIPQGAPTVSVVQARVIGS